MDVRPQAHEIIRTWLFSSVVRAHLEDDCLPWQHAAISGWILDPDRKKMSKSKGNVVTPMALLDEYSSDAVRYWAASGRPGTDTAFDVGQMKIGRRLAIKLLNASKFTLGMGAPDAGATITEPLDRALLVALADVVAQATSAFEDYNYAKALDLAESFFWNFTDDYVELVKERVYSEDASAQSAKLALTTALDTLLHLFAPFLPFTTEEVWSWTHAASIHRSSWPEAGAIRALAGDGDPRVLTDIGTALSLVRKSKSEAKASMRTEVTTAVISGPAAAIARIEGCARDLKGAGRIQTLELVPSDATEITAELTLAPASE
jgi:valyl-tRNA synthetase